MRKLDRTTFESSRTGEYFDAQQLSALTGVPQDEFASVCLKELIDLPVRLRLNGLRRACLPLRHDVDATLHQLRGQG